MFYYLKGQLVFTEPTSAVVDCGGVGYKLTISTNTLAKLTSLARRYASIRIFMSEKTRWSCLASFP